jgi:hypothetical protein
MLINTKKDLEPNIKSYLEGIEDKFLFHTNYGLKHPLALYNVSFGKVENDLQDFFVAYNDIKVADFLPDKKGDEKIREVLKRYRVLLYSLREHLDDCFHIVKSFIAPQPQFVDDRNQYNWLKRNIKTPCVTAFLSNIDSYKKFLDNIVNELKHNNAVINGIVFFDERSNDFSLGYYIANVSNERYEPVSKIHQKFHEQDTAFSLARDVRYNICNIFQLSEELIRVITELGIQVSRPPEKEVNKKRHDLYDNITDLPRYFFPDEYSKDVPSVALRDDGTLKLEIPSKFSLKPLHHNRVLLFHSGDGKTRSFAMLYFSKETTK